MTYKYTTMKKFTSKNFD
uniref:Uncharacterized protein n=1 Tax=Arundo donax TaxID=35708 RepID=A0A0A8ZAU2_ARUDO